MAIPFLSKFNFPKPELNFTPEEVDKLEKFRARVNHIYPLPDFKLMSWLRARDLDLDKAEQMLRKHLTWRKVNQITELLLWESPKVFFPYMHSGFDKEGVPVVIMPVGRWDLRGSIEQGIILPALKYILQSLEILVSTGSIMGVYEANIIMDFDGFSYSQITHRSVIQGIIEIVRLFEANYPEVLKNCYIINAPKIFFIVFAVVKPLLHSRTLSKIQIFGDDKVKWKLALSKVISQEEIPPYWGGTKPGRDDFCSEAWFQEPLPPNYFRKLGSYYDDYGEEWISVKVNAGEDLKFDYYVVGARGRVLKWNFKSEGYNTGFSVETESGKEIVGYRVVNSHLKPEEGKMRLRKAGKYSLIFHNSFSRSRAKIVHYRISLLKMEQLSE